MSIVPVYIPSSCNIFLQGSLGLRKDNPGMVDFGCNNNAIILGTKDISNQSLW